MVCPLMTTPTANRCHAVILPCTTPSPSTLVSPLLTSKRERCQHFKCVQSRCPNLKNGQTRNVVRRKSDRQVGQGSVCASFMTNRCHASDFAHETFFLTRNVQHKKLTRRSTPDKGTETEDTAVSQTKHVETNPAEEVSVAKRHIVQLRGRASSTKTRPIGRSIQNI